MSRLFLGIDCGTQGTKAIVVDQKGAIFGRGYARHALMERENGAREQDPQWWVDAMISAVQAAVAQVDMSRIVALSVSGQQHGLVVLDASKQVLRPAKLWNDTQTAPENEELIARMGGTEACFETFGIVPLTGYTVSKLLWLQKHEPETFERVRHILLPHEYLNFWLTGQMLAEYGDASGTAYFDPRTRTWSDEVLSKIDGGSGQLRAALPRIAGPEELVGTVRAEVATLLGIPSTCVVATGGGDNMMGAIGTGNVTQGVVTVSLGTSSTVYSYSDRYVGESTGNIAPFCSSSGGWLPLVCTMNATNVVTQSAELLARAVTDVDAALLATEPGAGGMTFLPFLNGERTPNLPTAKGTITGISSNNFTTDYLLRAAVEGTSFGVLEGLNLVCAGKEAKVLVVIGGGARSQQWCQLLADASGARVEVPVEEEAGCLGAAMQAMYAWNAQEGTPVTFAELASACVRMDVARSTEPVLERRAAYDRARQEYRRQLQRLYY